MLRVKNLLMNYCEAFFITKSILLCLKKNHKEPRKI